MGKKAFKAVVIVALILFVCACFAGCDIDNDVRNSASGFLKSSGAAAGGEAYDPATAENSDKSVNGGSSDKSVSGDAIDPLTGEKTADDTGNKNETGDNNGVNDAGDNKDKEQNDNGNGSTDNGGGSDNKDDLSNYNDYGPIVEFE